MNIFKWFMSTSEEENSEKKDIPEVTRKQIKYEDKMYEVGVTTALVIFDDGREVHTKMYGYVKQYVYYEASYGFLRPTRNELIVRAAWVITSLEVYRSFLHDVVPDQLSKVVDDPNNPTVAWTGRIAHLEVFETLPHQVCYRTAYLEEIKDEATTDSSNISVS